LKKFKHLAGEDEFKEAVSCNKVMQHIQQVGDNEETFWKCKWRISGHDDHLNKNHSSWKGDKCNVKVEWKNAEVSREPSPHTIAADDPVMRVIHAKDN
jgi:hypothetical protein